MGDGVIGGSIDVIRYFQMRLLAGGDGTGKAIADFDLTYTRNGETPSLKVDAVALAAANTPHTANRGIEVDPTDAPALYRFDFPDAAYAVGVRDVMLSIKHTDCFTETARIPIDNGSYAGPHGRGVYLDGAAANTDTELGIDGTDLNPVSEIAAAKTLADNLGVKRIYLINGSDVTLAATMEYYEIIGIGEMSMHTVTVGGQDVDGSHFRNVLITGAQGGTSRFQATGCCLSVITGMEITALECLLANGGSLTLRDDCAFVGCYSAVAGGATPTLNINSVGANVYFRDYSGGLEVTNAVAATVMSYDCPAGQIVIDATCTDLQIHARGCLAVTDNGTTTDFNSEAAINLTNIENAVCDALLTGTSHNIPTSLGKRVRQASEVAPVLNEGTAQAGGASTITLAAAASANDDEYHDAYVSIIAGTGVGQIRSFITYVGATRVGTVSKPWVTNPDATSEYVVAGSSSVDLHTIQDSTTAVDNLKAACDAYTAAGGLAGTLALVLGALTDAAATGAPTSADTIMAYVKQGINSLPRKNVAQPDIPFLMVLTSDHVTPATSLTVTATRSLDGGAWTAVTGSIAEVGNGAYSFDAAAADKNGTICQFRFVAATADDRFLTLVTAP